jgi:TatD DNase family protein
LAAADLKTSKNNLKIAKKYNFLYSAIGIHPQSPVEKVEELEKLIDKNVIAIGECGLEFIGEYDENKQRTCFKK